MNPQSMLGILIPVLMLFLTVPVYAGPPSKVVEETAEFLFKKFGRSAVTGGMESISARLAKLAAQHGEDALLLVRKAGPHGITALEQAGDKAPVLIRWVKTYGDDAAAMIHHPAQVQLALKHGDDAAGVLARHSSLAERLITQQGQVAIQPLKSLSSRHARQLVMLADEKTLIPPGRFHEILIVVGKYGDQAMEFIWKHRRLLASATLLTAFVSNPEPYLNGIQKLMDTAGRIVVEPITAMGREVGKNTNGTIVLSIIAFLAFLMIGLWLWLPQYLSYRQKSQAVAAPETCVMTDPVTTKIPSTERVDTMPEIPASLHSNIVESPALAGQPVSS